ncbi:MAG: hypothetical protein ACLFRA_01620 [Alphaproteobacteria bacterium]
MSENKNEEQTEPVYLDQHGNPIPLLKNESEEKNEKTGYRFGIVSFFTLVIGILLILTLTPAYSLLINIMPVSIQEKILSPLFRRVVLSEMPRIYDEPMKIEFPKDIKTLPVLGFDTGICFSFYASIETPNPENINTKRLEGARRNKPIAEIIAIDTLNKYEYHLKSTTYKENFDSENRKMSIICQKFGREYASTPRQISALYIRPLSPFKAQKTAWISTKHLYDNQSSPVYTEPF